MSLNLCKELVPNHTLCEDPVRGTSVHQGGLQNQSVCPYCHVPDVPMPSEKTCRLIKMNICFNEHFVE